MMMNEKQPNEEQKMFRLLSVDEAAYLLGVSPWTIRDWIKRGLLGSNKLGSRRLVPETEINRLIEASAKPARRERLFV